MERQQHWLVPRQSRPPLVKTALELADPFFWLARSVLSHVSETVLVTCDRWHHWLTTFAARRFLSVAVLVSPNMTCHQRQQLLFYVGRTVEHLLTRGTVDIGVFRGIVALGCTNRETTLLLGYLVEVIASIVNDPFAAENAPMQNEEVVERRGGDVESTVDGIRSAGDEDRANSATECSELRSSGTEIADVISQPSEQKCVSSVEETCDSRQAAGQEEGALATVTAKEKGEVEVAERIEWAILSHSERDAAAVVHILLNRFKLPLPFVAVMPSKVQRAVVEALWGSPDVRGLLNEHRQRLSDAAAATCPAQNSLPWRQRVHAAPVCCITLEILVLEDESVASDVVAVVQRNAFTGRIHGFLYKGWALRTWIGGGHVATSPHTRSVVLPTDIYRLT
jgi:hypothetical protein